MKKSSLIILVSILLISVTAICTIAYINEKDEDNTIPDNYIIVFKGESAETVYTTYVIEIRNRLQLGDTLELLIPNQLEPEIFNIEKMWDTETKEPVSHVNPGKEGQTVILEIPYKADKGWILRRKK